MFHFIQSELNTFKNSGFTPSGRALKFTVYTRLKIMQNLIKKRWAEGQQIVNGWLSIPSSVSAEIMSNQPFDSITIDMQHGLVGYENLIPMLAAIPPSITPMTRVPWLEPGIIMKSLDAACHGIICPMINTAQDAQQFIQAMRYPPDGIRSYGPTRALLKDGADYPKKANSECIAWAMIETKQAIDNLDAILATPGLDAVYVGPADLSNSLGHPPRLDPEIPEVVEAIDLIVAKSKEHKLRVGIHTGSSAYAKRMLAKGFDMISLMSDARLMVAGCANELGALRDKKPQSDAVIY